MHLRVALNALSDIETFTIGSAKMKMILRERVTIRGDLLKISPTLTLSAKKSAQIHHADKAPAPNITAVSNAIALLRSI